MNVEFYTDLNGEWRWTVRAGNGRIVADSGEGYANKADAVHGYRLVVGPDVDELTE